MSKDWISEKNRPLRIGLCGFWPSFIHYQKNYPVLGLLESIVPVETVYIDPSSDMDDVDIILCSLFGDRVRPKWLEGKFCTQCVGEPDLWYPRSCIWGDYKIGFQPDDHDNLYFPLWQQSLIYYENKHFSITETTRPYIEKTKFCANYSSHDSTGIRTRLCDIISMIGSIDYYGSWRNNQPLDNKLGATDIERGKAKMSVLDHYKFSVCPENSVQDWYMTEKLPEALVPNTIPIYIGDPKIGETALNPRRIINATFMKDASELLQTMMMVHLPDIMSEPLLTRPLFPLGIHERGERWMRRILEEY